VQRVSTAHAEDVVDSLCAKLLAGKREQERDVAAIGLKTMVTDLPSGPLAALVVQRLCPKLVAGVQSKARAAWGPPAVAARVHGKGGADAAARRRPRTTS